MHVRRGDLGRPALWMPVPYTDPFVPTQPQEQGSHWPHLTDGCRMFLDVDSGALSRARHWVLDRAADAGVPDVDLAAVELLSGELLANAVRHGPQGGAVEVD